MLTKKTINTINYLRKVHGALPLFSNKDIPTEFPCMVYKTHAVYILDSNENCHHECAYLTTAEDVIYVDGGFKRMDGTGVIGIYFEKTKEYIHKVITDISSSLDVEMEGIILALEVCRGKKDISSVEIRTDNRTCVGLFHKDLNSPVEKTARVERFFAALEDFSNEYLLNIGWVRGHKDWKGNRVADKITSSKKPPNNKEMRKFIDRLCNDVNQSRV